MPDFDLQTDAALTTVARHLVCAALERYADNAWEMYPELGQHLYDEVERRAIQMVGAWPEKELFQVAYEHLEQLTTDWAREHPGET